MPAFVEYTKRIIEAGGWGPRILVYESYEEDIAPRGGVPLPNARKRPVVTWWLLGANVVVWLISSAAGANDDPEVLIDLGAMFGPLIARGEYWRLFTAMFLHAGIVHLAFNAFGLFIFGQLVERTYGHARFLTIYVLAGLSGSVASYLFNSIAPGVGASGAVFGVLGALAAFFLAQRNTFGSVARQNLAGLLLFTGVNLVFGFATPGIDNWAHIGGLAAGFGLGLALAPRYRLVNTAFGTPTGLADTNSLSKRLWVFPIAALVLVLGAWLATATLPDNPYTRIYLAEHFYEQGDYGPALQELDRSVAIDPTAAEAYYLRGKIYADTGNVSRARSELGNAIRFGGPDIRQRAVALLFLLNSPRR